MNQSDDAEKRRGWVATTHPLVARGLIHVQHNVSANTEYKLSTYVRSNYGIIATGYRHNALSVAATARC